MTDVHKVLSVEDLVQMDEVGVGILLTGRPGWVFCWEQACRIPRLPRCLAALGKPKSTDQGFSVRSRGPGSLSSACPRVCLASSPPLVLIATGPHTSPAATLLTPWADASLVSFPSTVLPESLLLPQNPRALEVAGTWETKQKAFPGCDPCRVPHVAWSFHNDGKESKILN